MRAVVVRAPRAGPRRSPWSMSLARRRRAARSLVEVEAVGVNPVDLGNRADPSWAGISPPYVVGYELAGRVVDTGEPVWALLPVQGTTQGALAEQVVVPRRVRRAAAAGAGPDRRGRAADGRLYRAPGAAADAAGGRVVGARPRGAGGVGHLLVQMARGLGLHVAAASRPQDRRRLEELGVDLWLDRSEPAPAAAAVASLGHELDAVVDLVGGQLEPSLPHVRVGGHAATIVDLTGDLDLAIDRNIDLHGVLMRAGPRPALRARGRGRRRRPPARRRHLPARAQSPTPTAASRPAASAASW